MSELTLSDRLALMPAMTEEEAQEWRASVGSAAKRLRVLLDEGYQRKAWIALGFANWTGLLEDLAQEFGYSQNYVWRLHAANQTERLLDYSQVGQLPETHMRALNVAGATDDDKRATRASPRRFDRHQIASFAQRPDGALGTANYRSNQLFCCLG